MSGLSLAVVVIFIGLLWVSRMMNHIPKTGRDGKANGETISAVITNTNKNADTAVVMRAEKDGRKFKVKIKPTEARLWIKGDSINIRLSEDGKNYRVLFNEYFRENEQRLREKALDKLKKVSDARMASVLTGYKKEYYDAFEKSKLTSQEIFSFATGMRLIDIYSVVTVVLVALGVWWYFTFSRNVSDAFLPGALVLIVFWSVYNSVTLCKNVVRKITVHDKEL